MRSASKAIFTFLLLASAAAWGLEDSPSLLSSPSAEEIIRQVWFVNHLRAVDRYALRKKGDAIAYLVYRNADNKYRFRTLERFLRNDFPPDDGIIAQDLTIFHYPTSVRGTGILITDYIDPDRSQDLRIWLPALRKVRRFAEPNHDDSFAGTDWTYGDVSLRKPHHETHQVIRIEKFGQSPGGARLNIIDVDLGEKPPFMNYSPEATEEFGNRYCYVVKSSTKKRDYWYDYRVSWVDIDTFADYRTLYYKDEKEIKLIDRNWQPMNGRSGLKDVEDPRALYWVMWYGKNLVTGHETMAVIPPSVGEWNTDIPDSTWSIRNLERSRR